MNIREMIKVAMDTRWCCLGMILLSDQVLASLPVKQGTSMCTLGDCSLRSIPMTGAQSPNVDRAINEAAAAQQTRSSKGASDGKSVRDRPKRSEIVDRIKRSHARTLVVDTWEPGRDPGNLPSVYVGVNWTDFQASPQTAMISPQIGAKLKGIRTGDVLMAVIEDEIEVWPGRANPVRAFVTGGAYSGAILSGEAVMEPARKKVMITFEKLRLKDAADSIYKLKAEVRTLAGRTGLDGNYHSESAKFFIGEMLAGTAAGFADATIQRNQNSQGNYVQEPSVANAAKTGAVVALSKRAERFANEGAHAPEWTESSGYQEVQVFVQADPIEDNS